MSNHVVGELATRGTAPTDEGSILGQRTALHSIARIARSFHPAYTDDMSRWRGKPIISRPKSWRWRGYAEVLIITEVVVDQLDAYRSATNWMGNIQQRGQSKASAIFINEAMQHHVQLVARWRRFVPCCAAVSEMASSNPTRSIILT